MSEVGKQPFVESRKSQIRKFLGHSAIANPAIFWDMPESANLYQIGAQLCLETVPKTVFLHDFMYNLTHWRPYGCFQPPYFGNF